jgi:hypothetical protein
MGLFGKWTYLFDKVQDKKCVDVPVVGVPFPTIPEKRAESREKCENSSPAR